MINLMNLKLTSIIRKKQILSEETIDLNKYNKFLATYIYPIGILPINAFESNTVFNTLSEDEKVDYFKALLHSMFNNIYTEEEYNIIIYYLISRIYEKLTYPNDLLTKLESLVHVQEEKKEIIYFQEEIKFRLATHYSLTMSNEERLFELLDELEPIEDSHNEFQIDLRKD